MCAKNIILRPIVLQLFVTGSYSFCGMGFVALLQALLSYYPNKQIIFGFFGGLLINYIIIGFCINPINLFLLLLLHYLKSFPFFIYQKLGVIIESMFFYFLLCFFDKIFICNVLMGIVLTCLSIIILLNIAKFLFSKRFRVFQHEYNSICAKTEIRYKYFFGKRFDVLFSLIFTGIPILLMSIAYLIYKRS